MYDRIVIPVDGSDEARAAARRGLDVARTFDATVDVVSVVERRSLRLTRSSDEEARVRERHEEALVEIESLPSEFDRSLTTTVLEGNPAQRISEYAAERDASLIVLGRQGTTSLGKRFLGGVTEHVLHRCDVPVLVVPDGERATEADVDYARVLVLTDGSENAEAATRHGATIVRRYGATVHVLNVVDVQAAGGVFDASGLDEAFVERLEADGEAAVERVADEVRDAAPDSPLETAVERTDSFDGAAAGIREYVAANDVDLVVMGSHGRSNLRRQLRGSVSSAVLRSVDVPVLVVPSQQ